MLVDSHCHLNFPDFAEDLPETVERARKAGVGLMVTISTKLREFESVFRVAEAYPDIYCSVGVHPHEAENEPETTAEKLIELAQHPKVVGIGETGLDYYYEHSPRDVQRKIFREHIKAARETGLPVIIHTRNAESDTAEIIRDEMAEGAFTGLIHCFTSTREMAEAALAAGMYISVSGIATFKKATELQDVLRGIPLSRMLVETDSPYLAPAPHRGKRNEPAFVRHTAEFLAGLKGVSVEEVERVTTENFLGLFGKIKVSL